MPFGHIESRLGRLRARMAEENLDVLVVLSSENYNGESVAYISGFTGSSGAVLISGDRAILVTDGRYAVQAREQSPFQVVLQGRESLRDRTVEALRDGGWGIAGFEAGRLSVDLFRSLEGSVPMWRDCSALLPSLRRCKDGVEVAAISRAADIACSAYEEALEHVRVGMTEIEFNALLEYLVRKLGAECGWKGGRFVVASGERGAMPHGRATERTFKPGDIVTVDFGATVDGYMSDLTRNFSMGPLAARGREIEAVLLEAAAAAAEAISPGVAGSLVDSVARGIITDRGWGGNFSHGLGHGLGLEIHEPPRLSPLTEDVLRVGDVVTIEPGIYIEGWGGMRIEDDYLVTESGAVCISGGRGRSAREISV